MHAGRTHVVVTAAHSWHRRILVQSQVKGGTAYAACADLARQYLVTDPCALQIDLVQLPVERNLRLTEGILFSA